MAAGEGSARRGAGARDDRARALALVPVSRETETLFEDYLARLRRWLPAKNLIGPATVDQAWTRHIADSAQLDALAPAAKRWVDLGSGAGLPGLVIAMIRRRDPDFRMHLVESNARKCAFMREIIREQDLPAELHDGRIEDVVPELEERFDVVSARALAPLADLLRMSRKMLTKGALGLFPKGQNVTDELTEAAACWTVGFSTVPSRTDPDARIVVITSLEEARAG